MFEKYTEKARRVIFSARSDAGECGSPHIETEHILLALLREDKTLSHRFLLENTAVEQIRAEIQVLVYAAEEADDLSDKHIGTEHLLLGLLREEKSFAAALLHEHGIEVNVVCQQLRRNDAQ
jgi:ATP-dependent Clp protease ATP-binding subunit ClpC